VHAKTTPEQIQQSAVTGKETLRGTCYSKKENNKHTYFCRINEKILGPYNENMEIYFSRDRSAYCLMGTEQHYFFHSDTRSGPFKNPSNPVITNDGKSFAFRYYGTTGSDSLKNCFGSIFQCGANITYCCSLSWLKYYSSGPAFFDTNKQSPYMMYDGHIMGPFYYVSEPILSPDGNKIAFHFKKEAGKLYLYNQATQKSVKTKIYNDYLYYNGSPHDVSGLRDFSIHRAGISNDMSKYCLSAFSDTGECKYIHINGITYGPFRAADFECYGNDIFVAIVEGESVSILKF